MSLLAVRRTDHMLNLAHGKRVLMHEQFEFINQGIIKHLRVISVNDHECPSADLEYRAKLNEIFLADKSFETLLRKFVLEQRDNPENPHSYASFRLVNGISQKVGERIELSKLDSLNKARIQKSARDLLSEDTKRLEKKDSVRSAGVAVSASLAQ